MSFLFSPCRPCCVSVPPIEPSGEPPIYIPTNCCDPIPSSLCLVFIGSSGYFGILPSGHKVEHTQIPLNYEIVDLFSSGHYWYKHSSGNPETTNNYAGIAGTYSSSYNNPELPTCYRILDFSATGCTECQTTEIGECSYMQTTFAMRCLYSAPSGCENIYGLDVNYGDVAGVSYNYNSYIRSCNCGDYYASGQLIYEPFGTPINRFDFLIIPSACPSLDQLCYFGTGTLYAYDLQKARPDPTDTYLGQADWLVNSGYYYWPNIYGSGLKIRCNEVNDKFEYKYGNNTSWSYFSNYTETFTTYKSYKNPFVQYLKFGEYQPTGYLLLTDKYFDPSIKRMGRCSLPFNKNLTGTLTNYCIGGGTEVDTFSVSGVLFPGTVGVYLRLLGDAVVSNTCLVGSPGPDVNFDCKVNLYNACRASQNEFISDQVPTSPSSCYYSCDPFYIRYEGFTTYGTKFKYEISE